MRQLERGLLLVRFHVLSVHLYSYFSSGLYAFALAVAVMVSIGAGDEVRRSPRNGHVSSSEGVRIGDLERLNAPIATMHPHEAAADSDRKLQQNFTWKDEAGPNATGLALPRRKDPGENTAARPKLLFLVTTDNLCKSATTV